MIEKRLDLLRLKRPFGDSGLRGTTGEPSLAAENTDGWRGEFMDYDLLVIGGGTAGMSALKAAVKLGAKVAVVEAESFAGTCLRTG